jgi:hypothetical protein
VKFARRDSFAAIEPARVASGPDGPFAQPRPPPVRPPARVVCDHRHSSSVAAATLVELRLDASDVIGGFDA